MKTAHLLALALTATFAAAQETPQPPPPLDRPPVPREDLRRERPPGERPEARRPDGERPPEGRRSEGERRPERNAADGEQPRPFNRRLGALFPQGEQPKKPTAFLGVVTSPMPPVLAAQLGLPEGFGLVVNEVMPDSPAAQAGVQRHDVLKTLDDQQLVSPEQLAALVRARGKDAEVALTLLRKGEEQKVRVKVAERMMPERSPLQLPDELRRRIEEFRGPEVENVERMQRQFRERMKGFQEQMEKFQERMKEWSKNPVPPAPEAPKFEPFGARDTPGERPAEPRARGDARVESSAKSNVVIADQSGRIEITGRDGRRTLVAHDPQGAVIFNGPIDTEEQRRALPESIREKIAKIQVNTHADRPAPDAQ